MLPRWLTYQCANSSAATIIFSNKAFSVRCLQWVFSPIFLSLCLSISFFFFSFFTVSTNTLFSLLFLNFYVIGMYPSHSPKTIYYVHVTSLLLCPLLPLEMALPLMNICSSSSSDMHEKVSSFQKNGILNDNNINLEPEKQPILDYIVSYSVT